MTAVTQSQKFTALTILLGILGLLSFCIGGLSLMNMDTMASGDCPMTHQTALCPMAMAERLSVWQQLLIPSSLNSIILTLIFLTATPALALSSKILSNTSPPPLLWRRLFETLISFADYLTQQFSQSILHPKIY